MRPSKSETPPRVGVGATAQALVAAAELLLRPLLTEALALALALAHLAITAVAAVAAVVALMLPEAEPPSTVGLGEEWAARPVLVLGSGEPSTKRTRKGKESSSSTRVLPRATARQIARHSRISSEAGLQGAKVQVQITGRRVLRHTQTTLRAWPNALRGRWTSSSARETCESGSEWKLCGKRGRAEATEAAVQTLETFSAAVLVVIVPVPTAESLQSHRAL